MTSATRSTPPIRRILAATTLLGVAAALVGCSQIPSSDRHDCTPTEAFEVERTGEGSGPVITDDGVAIMRVTIEDAAGQLVADDTPVSPSPTGEPGPIRVGMLIPGLVELARCASAGETVSASMTMAQFAGPESATAPGTDPNAVHRITLKVDQVFHSAAAGRIAPQRNGIPAVVNAPGGGHGVTMPAGPAPTETRTAETISGLGTPIEAGDVVVAQYSSYSWNRGELLDSSWTKHEPVRLVAGDEADQLGLSTAMVGVRNGTQLVVIVPGSKLAEAGLGFVDAGDAMVFVIDVLGVQR